ncbi:MAG: ribose 5-phosphate isomerase A [Clostridia bacterium]|nr:ribose 5-phosphate isomerase A [Clostridia bacterium]
MGDAVAEYAKNGQTIGVGTGSSSYVGLTRLALRGLDITVIPAASEIRLACAALGIPTATLEESRPDWCFDGADEVAANGDVIKGRGGGLLGEKLIIASSPRRILLADSTKLVERAGERFPVPVELLPEALELVRENIARLGATEIELRMAVNKDGAIITERGNVLLDCRFGRIYPGLERDIKALPGVVESGLFQDYGFEVIS